MIDRITHLFVVGWRSAFEIVLLSVVIYYGYLYFRGTRGAKVLTGLAIVFLALTLITTLLKLAVIGWILRSFSVFLAIALVVIFQPELRRALAELGGHPIFSLTSEKREMVHDLAEAVTQLSAKQFGALIAIERDTSIRVYEETGGISICHRRRLERDFTPETFRKRIGELLLQRSYDEEIDSEKLAGEDHLPPPRDHALVPDQKERGNDPIAV